MNRLEEFFQELSQLTQKYGFKIDGCGCCGSPYISDSKNKVVAESLWYDDKEQKYEYDVEYCQPIEKGGDDNA